MRVNGAVCTKPGSVIAADDLVEAELSKKYAGFAGFKLEHALSFFKIDVTGFVCVDAGLSTGGFADCLLQHGAKKVYGIDVGSAQVDAELSKDSRLVVMEQTNLKDVTALPDEIDFCTLDVSFTSVIPLIPVVNRLFVPHRAGIIILIKPQFEVGPAHVSASGIVHDVNEQQRACSQVAKALKEVGFAVQGITPAPRKETTANQEFLIYAVR